MTDKRDVGAPDLKIVVGGQIEHRGGDTTGGKLTARQQGFVNSILAGEDQVTAYELNYSTSGMARKTMYEAASRLFASNKVSARIKAGQARQSDAALLSGLATRQHIQKRLMEMTQEDKPDATVLRGCDLLGRLTDVAAFTDRVEHVTDNTTPEELTEELEAALLKAIGE